MASPRGGGRAWPRHRGTRALLTPGPPLTPGASPGFLGRGTPDAGPDSLTPGSSRGLSWGTPGTPGLRPGLAGPGFLAAGGTPGLRPGLAAPRSDTRDS